jgi:hypothetical protein
MGEWMYTSELDGDEWSVSRPGCLTRWEEPLLLTRWELRWAPEPAWTLWWQENNPFWQEPNSGRPVRSLAIEGHLQNSYTHLITPSRKSVEVRWRSLFRSMSLGERCTSYNAPPTSRKRAADRSSLRNFLTRSFLFMVGKAHKSHGARSELNSVFGFEKVDRWHPIRTSAIQSRSRPMQYLGFSNYEKGAPRQEISKW